jgi:RNA polymerase sigma-70 factor (ECF subfamily)
MSPSDHNPPDGTLVAAALMGEDAAFERLVQRYQPALLHVAHNRLGRRELAEDAVQEAFLCAFKWLDSYDSKYSFRTWLWTILLNQCTRIGQKQARHGQLSLSPLPQEAELAESPFERLLKQESTEQLQSLLSRLPDMQADALRLRFFGGLKFQEIADAMGISESGAKNRVKLGLVQLSAWLREEMPAADGATRIEAKLGERS